LKFRKLAITFSLFNVNISGSIISDADNQAGEYMYRFLIEN